MSISAARSVWNVNHVRRFLDYCTSSFLFSVFMSTGQNISEAAAQGNIILSRYESYLSVLFFFFFEWQLFFVVLLTGSFNFAVWKSGRKWWGKSDLSLQPFNIKNMNKENTEFSLHYKYTRPSVQLKTFYVQTVISLSSNSHPLLTMNLELHRCDVVHAFFFHQRETHLLCTASA